MKCEYTTCFRVQRLQTGILTESLQGIVGRQLNHSIEDARLHLHKLHCLSDTLTQGRHRLVFVHLAIEEACHLVEHIQILGEGFDSGIGLFWPRAIIQIGYTFHGPQGLPVQNRNKIGPTVTSVTKGHGSIHWQNVLQPCTDLSNRLRTGLNTTVVKQHLPVGILVLAYGLHYHVGSICYGTEEESRP